MLLKLVKSILSTTALSSLASLTVIVYLENSLSPLNLELTALYHIILLHLGLLDAIVLGSQFHHHHFIHTCFVFTLLCGLYSFAIQNYCSCTTLC
jgi:hypothetical protein